MKRVLAIWLPNWPIQRLVQARPELAGRAIVLHSATRRGPCATACSAAARRAGVELGMPAAEAMAIVSRVPQGGPSAFEEHEGAADRAALVELAQWCHRFSPTVGLEEAEAPETLLLDATNLAPLYGGEAELVAQVAQAMRRRGLEARLALADTLGAAWALVHFGEPAMPPTCVPLASRQCDVPKDPGLKTVLTKSSDGATLVPASALAGRQWHTRQWHTAEPLTAEGDGSTALLALPTAALRLADELTDTLAGLGVASVGDVLALPRDQLRSRFGPDLLLRINQLTGATPEMIAAVEPPETFAVAQAFEYPIARHDAIRYAVQRLLERLAWLLAARNAGALELTCQLECEGTTAAAFQFGLFQATAHARHLLELAELQLERLRLPAPATAIEIRVQRHARLGHRQATFFEEERELGHSRLLAALVDRLAGRLGSSAVVRCRLASDAQPELAYREEPLVSGASSSKTSQRRQPSFGSPRRKNKEPLRAAPALPGIGALDRPLYLLARPAALETTSVVPEGPPISFRRAGERHQIARQWGPERIETGWWRRERAVRDYYRAETNEGRRFWLFRRRSDGRWFLHGTWE